ncbi:hypothetical protein [Bacillus coahuilensis]|uniref:hypothetical protein n=1 Tax=Bacillus coahuilensis TaxID=408580 RepID=UPI0001851231|nr:hypothetical protein [Bacillus coahuilensis]
MEILQELKERVAALYKKAEDEKCEDTFIKARDLEFQYKMTILYHSEQFPND